MSSGDGRKMLDDLSFDVWMTRVEDILQKTIGFGSADLPEWGWLLAWDAGMTPARAAAKATEHAGLSPAER
jgi:hypothetical protein